MIPTFREILDSVGRILHDEGGVGAILIDLAPLAQIERSYGGAAYEGLRKQIDPLMLDLRDRVRAGDLLARDEREGDRFLMFFAGRREGGPAFHARDLRGLANRIEELVAPRVARIALPYMRSGPPVEVGYAFVLHSPLEGKERQILRLIGEASTSADLRRRTRERDERETLLEVIYNRKVWTAFQTIQEIESRNVMGHEGLSRGPRGSDIESPGALFGLAARHGLTEELERACRRQLFIDWSVLGASGRLFVNTVPATVRDPSFLGRGVLDFLGPSVSPRQVTLEITERQAIENLSLYREAMHAFLDMGFTFAIDDLGAGYSGLEIVASLGASYLKIDMGLVRDLHQKRVNQQVVKAIADMAAGVGATVIAEGIQTPEEAEAVMALGIRYGQGYLWGRPVDPYAPKPHVAVQS